MITGYPTLKKFAGDITNGSVCGMRQGGITNGSVCGMRQGGITNGNVCGMRQGMRNLLYVKQQQLQPRPF